MTDQKKNQFKIKQIFRGIVLFFLITMSLYHVLFDEFSNEQISHKKTYNPIIVERNSSQDLLLDEFEKNKITKSEFLKLYKSQTNFYKEKINNYNYKKKDLALEHSFNGRNSFHYWLFIFGLSFSFFVLSLRYTFRIIYEHKNKNFKKSLLFEASAWMAVSLFWVSHTVFKKTDDLPTTIYALVTFIICFAISFSIFYVLKYMSERKEHTLESYRKSIVNLVTLISDIRINHYFLMAATAMTKDNKKEIEKDVEIVDEKIFSAIEKVADGEG